MRGNLTELAAGCGHCQWWHTTKSSERKPFALPGTVKRYAPDLSVKIHHLKLVIDVDPEKRSLAGVCHTTLEPIAEPLEQIFFESEDLAIERVSVAGASESLQFESTEHGFNVLLPQPLLPGNRLEIAVQYHTVSPKAGIYFTGPSLFYPDKPYQVWTQGQDEDAHFWYPTAAADYPNHKMTSEVVVTVPDKYTALSNGKLTLERENTASGTRTFHWLHSQPHVPYLVTLAVGVYVKLEECYNGMPVECYVDPALAERARLYFKGTADLVALYSRLYGVEYPWSSKYSQVMVQDFIFGGMENTTMTTITDRILADESNYDEYRRAMIRLNAHELNHHWNGDCITCRDWSHAWLNEGAATYAEVEAMEFLLGKKERDYYLKGLSDLYFAEDARYRRPIVTNLYREPIDLFDSTLYKKGGLVRHMIRYLLGDEGYYRSVKTFLTDNAYQCVETIDLIKAIEKATGRNLRAFFDQWVFGTGFPEYKISYSWDRKARVATVKVSQTQKLAEGTGLFSMPVVFSFTLADGSSHNYTLEVADQDNSFHFHFDSKPVMFRFDPDNWILKTVDLHLPKTMLIHQLASDPSVMGRVHAAQALAKLGGVNAIEALERAVKSDFFWGVSVEAARGLGTIGTTAASEALRRCYPIADPQVRRAVVMSLGSFKDESTAALLAQAITSEEEHSQFVLAEAANSLGKTRAESAFAVLEALLPTPSWNEVVRVGALNGLAELDDERGVDLAIRYAAAGMPWLARPAAIAALGKLGKTQPRALSALISLGESDEASQFTLAMSIIAALGEAKKPEGRATLQHLAQVAGDGRVRRAVSLTLEAIDESKGQPSVDAETLKSTVKKLEDKVKDLTERLERQEAGQRRRAS